MTSEAQSTSLWYRLRFTPLRDVIRGRLTARLDVQAVIDSAGLPASLADLLRQVVRRTRLRRIEKADVAHELAAHFLDGLEAGASSEQLVKGFGDLKRAARLIRRAKRRGRGPAWRAGAWTLTTAKYLFFFALAAYLIQAVRLYNASPKVTRDYVAEWNAAALAIPEHERAWPVYRQAALATDAWPPPLRVEIRPGSGEWHKLQAFAAANQEPLRLYRTAAAMPVLGAVLRTTSDRELEAHWRGEEQAPVAADAQHADSDWLLSVTLPQMTVFREGTRLLAIDAYTAASAGDGGRVFQDLDALLGIARHGFEPDILISDLVAFAVIRTAAGVLGRVLRDQPDLLSAEQLVRLSHRLAGVRDDGRLNVRLDSERAFFADVVQRLYTDDGRGSGLPSGEFLRRHQQMWISDFGDDGRLNVPPFLSQVAMPALSLVMAQRQAVLERHGALMDAYEAQSALPLGRQDCSRVEFEILNLNRSLMDRVRYTLIVTMMPSLSRAIQLGEYTRQSRDALLAAIALELHQRRSGAWPKSLIELTPRLLPRVPLDRYDGQPLKYVLVDGRPVVYSVGVDRDDDGGRVPKGKDGNRAAREWRPVSDLSPSAAKRPGFEPVPDGDWMLWPPVD